MPAILLPVAAESAAKTIEMCCQNKKFHGFYVNF